MDEGGLLGLTQQLSSLGREMNCHEGSSPSSPTDNPFGLSTPISISPQPIYSVPHNSPANGVNHVSPARRSLFNSTVSEFYYVVINQHCPSNVTSCCKIEAQAYDIDQDGIYSY